MGFFVGILRNFLRSFFRDFFRDSCPGQLRVVFNRIFPGFLQDILLGFPPRFLSISGILFLENFSELLSKIRVGFLPELLPDDYLKISPGLLLEFLFKNFQHFRS